jgi:hypothetical protein
MLEFDQTLRTALRLNVRVLLLSVSGDGEGRYSSMKDLVQDVCRMYIAACALMVATP